MDTETSQTGAETPVVVSVMIAAYKAEATLERAVASALGQTLRAIEVIIVDDASPDGTFALAQRLAATDPRVRALRLDVNGGPSAARNAALGVARGRWIAILDADDAYAPDRLERLVALAEAQNADFFADNIELWSPQNAPTGERGYEAAKLTGMSPLTFMAFLEDSAYDQPDRNIGFVKPIMRKAFLDANALRYAPDIRCAEDWLLYGRALVRGARFQLTPDAYYRYTVDPGSLSQSRDRMVANITQLLDAAEHMERDMAGVGVGEAARAEELMTIRIRRLEKRRRKLSLKKLILDQPALRSLIYFVKGGKRSKAAAS